MMKMVNTPGKTRRLFLWQEYTLVVGLVALATWLKHLALPDIIPADVPILYILAIVITATFFGFGPSVFCCVLSMAAWNYFFFSTGDFFTFDIEMVPVSLIFLAVGLTISYLSSNLRKKTGEAKKEITLREQAEKNVTAERQQFNDVLETLPCYMILLNTDYHVVFANKFFRERFGESHGKRCYEFLFNRAEPCEVCETYKVLEKNAPLEWEWLGPDGHNYYIYDFPFKAADGSQLIMETGIDITVQKQALEALRKSRDEMEMNVQERTGELKEVNRLLRAKMVEHKEARDREQQIAKEWRETFDSITDMVSIQDKDCRLLRVNKAYADAVGKKPEELIGQKCHSVIHGLECPVEHCPHVETVKTFKPVTRELFETQLGLYLKVTTAPLYDENGDVSGSVHIAEDITERKRWEETIKISELRYRRLFEAAKDGILILDADTGLILDVNPFLIKLLGLSFNDFIGKNLWELGFLKDIIASKAKFLELQRNQYIRYEDLPLRTANGQLINVEFVSNLYEVDHQKIIQCNIRNITERKRAEEAFKESEQKYRRIIETTNEGVWMTDGERITVFVNKKMADMLGCQAEEILGKTPSVYLDKDQETAAAETRAKLKAGEQTQQEFKFRRKDGSALWVISNSAPVFDDEGKFTGTISLLTDITERKQAELLLAESQKHLERSQELAHLGSWEFDLVNDRLTWSDEVYRIFGLKPQEFGATYEAFLDAVHPEDRATVDKAYTSSIKEGRDHYEIEHRIVRKGTGEIRYVFEKCEHMRDETGIIVKSVGMVHDITGRKKAEEALRETRDYLDNLFNYANAPIIVWNQNFEITRFNRAFERLTGIRADEALDRKLDILFPQDSREASMNKIRKTAAGERWEVVEIPILHSDGTVRVVLWNSAMIYASDGRTPVATIAQGQDITDLKETETELQQINNRLEMAYDAADAGAWDYDLVSGRNEWTPKIFELFGLDPHKTTPSFEAWKNIVNHEDREFTMKHIDQALKNHTPVGCEFRVSQPNGQIRWINALGKGIYDGMNQPVRLIGICTDITDLKKAEQMKDEFIGLVSHELRTPLTVVTGSLRTAMSQGLTGEEVHELIQNGIEGADQLASILENMLELSRYQAGHLKLRSEPVSIPGSTRNVIQKLKDQGASHKFVMEFPGELPPVEADPVRVERILYNLLENATKYTPAGTRIKISARTDKDLIITSIADHGPGITREDQAKLFELFQQLEPSTRPTSGAGLGLVVCKRLVEAQGGWIKVTSAAGKGSTFSFALPKNDTPS